MRILLIEDDAVLGMAVRDQLIADGQSVDWMKRLDDAGAAIRVAVYDLVLLDLMLPDGRGLDFLKARRVAGDVTPVIILTARDQISDRIAGLNAGADDYLVKPFDLFELSARVNAVGRRYSGNPNPLIAIGNLAVDLAARTVRREGRPVALTAREWALFEAFLQRPNVLLSKAQLEERLYSFDAEIESNTIEVHIGRLRKKITSTHIATGEHVYGRYGFRRLLDADGASIWQPDVNWCGGMTEIIKISALADAHGALVVPHGSSVYSYHFVATRHNSPFAEFLMMAHDADKVVPMFHPLLLDEPVPENGRLKMSKLDKPGFGVRLNPACELHRPYPR